MRPGFCLFIAGLLAAGPGFAADSPPVPMNDVHRLTPAQVQRVLDDAAARREAAARDAPPRAITGEVGVTIGSHETREAFGTAAVPLGQSAVAIISIDSAEGGRGYAHRRY